MVAILVDKFNCAFSIGRALLSVAIATPWLISIVHINSFINSNVLISSYTWLCSYTLFPSTTASSTIGQMTDIRVPQEILFPTSQSTNEYSEVWCLNHQPCLHIWFHASPIPYMFPCLLIIIIIFTDFTIARTLRSLLSICNNIWLTWNCMWSRDTWNSPMTPTYVNLMIDVWVLYLLPENIW